MQVALQKASMYDRDPMGYRSTEACSVSNGKDTTAIGSRLLVGVQVWKMEDVCSHGVLQRMILS